MWNDVQHLNLYMLDHSRWSQLSSVTMATSTVQHPLGCLSCHDSTGSAGSYKHMGLRGIHGYRVNNISNIFTLCCRNCLFLPNLTCMVNSEPAPRHEISQHPPPGMTLKLPSILNWSCSELGLPPHPLHQTTRWLLLLMCTNNPICCGNKTIYKEVGWSAVDSSLLSWNKEEMPEDTVW